MKNNYDPVAAIYDRLSRLVFGRALIRAQTCLLSYIPPHSNILIAGGGTGWILEEITRIHPSGLQITYVEISRKMIARAQQRNWQQNEVLFVQQPVETFTADHKYDIVFTAFLFDNFSVAGADKTFVHLSALLHEKGHWLFADFQYDGAAWWQKGLLHAMLKFFRIICHIEAKTLNDMAPQFVQQGFQIIYSIDHYSGFIRSSVYSRKGL